MSQIAERPITRHVEDERRSGPAPRASARSSGAISPLDRLRGWWRRHPDLGWLTVLLAVGLVFRLALLYRIPPLFMPGDSQSFLTPAYDLARGLGFDPILKRPLGYPLLLAGTISLLGEDLRALVFVQAALGLVTVAATYWLGRLAFGRAAGVLAALSVAIGGQLLIYEHYVLAESVFAMLLTLAVLAFVATGRRLLPVLQSEASVLGGTGLPAENGSRGEGGSPRSGNQGRLPWRLAAAGGVALACASLFRPVAEILVPLLPVYFLVMAATRRQAVVLTAVAILGFAAVMVPAFAADLALRGGASSGALGEHLLWRITRSDSGYIRREHVPPDETGDWEATARRYVIREAVDRTLPQEIFEKLRQEQGLSAADADRIMRAVALEAIGRQAGRYVSSTLRMSVELFFGEDQQLGEVRKRDGERGYIDPQSRQRTWFAERVLHLGEPPSQAVENEFDRATFLTALYQPGRISWLLALGFVAGSVLSVVSRRYRPALLLTLAIPPVLLANAALAGPEARFRYPIDPLIAVLAFGGLVWLTTWVWSRARRFWPTATR